MPPTAELVGRVGRLTGQHPATQEGLTLSVRVLPGRGQGVQRVTACALTADTLGLATQQGDVYAVHLSKQRYVCLDSLQSPCTSASFMTRLSRRLFVGCADGVVQCYDVSASSRLAQLPGHRTAVVCLSTKSDTEQLLSASADAVLLWDMATFRQRRMLGEAPYGSSQAVFSPAGNLLAAATPSGSITLWDSKHLRELGRLQTPLGQQQTRFNSSSISISPDEQWLVVGCKAPALLLWYSLHDRELQYAVKLPANMFGVVQVQVLPDSTSAAVLTSNGCISFVDLQQPSITGQLQLTTPGCRAVSFSTDPRANSMAVVCSDGLLRLYDLSAVRARQHAQRPTQLQRLQQLQLLQLSTSAEVLPAVPSKGVSSAQPAGAARRSNVLADVGNVERGRGRGGAGPSAAGSSGAAAGATAGGSQQLRVRQLGETAAALNRSKLQGILLAFGEFPARYRRLIWEQLLQLPHNSAAFALLQDRGLHPAYKGLAQQMQAPGGASSSVAVRLAACLSQLAYWCPLFGEAGFLPDLAFPFIKLFGPKAESVFEAVATLLLNWCQGWFELFPNPPLPLLRRFLLMLSQHDLQLGGHLEQLGVPLLERLWGVMSCGMSELLPAADDWLVLWDNCLAAASGPAFYYAALAAYLITQRVNLLAVTNEQQLDRVLAARPAVDVRKVVKLAHQLLERTPEYALVGGTSLRPMPPGEGYPVFSEYPTGSVEAQQLERARIQEAEEALIRRRQVVAELQQRSKQVAFEAAALTSQRQQLAALDAQRRAALRAIEDSLSTAGARLDDRAKEEKLRQIRLAEEAYQASLASLRAEWSAELAALKADVEHKRRMAAATLKARQEEEDIKALEFQAQQRLWALQQEELAAAGSSALRDAASTQAIVLAAQLQRKAAEWQVEDEARSLKQQHELARKARLAAAAEKEAALQAAKGLMLAQELQTQEELTKVEHQRRLRQLAEAEAELTAQQLQLQAERQAVAAAAGGQALHEEAQEQAARFTQQQEVRTEAVTAEYAALQQQLAQLHLTAADLGSSARMSDVQQQMAQMESTLAAADREHAARVAGILRKLKGQTLADALRTSAERAGPSAAAASTGPSAAAPAAEAAAAAAVAYPTTTSLEDVEARLAAIRQRRAALESLYGAQVDAEVQRFVAESSQQQQQQRESQQSPTGASVRSQVTSRAPAPTSEASAGSGSSGSISQVSQATSGSSVDVSAELEHLLAEAEAEVQRELAAARVHLRGTSALCPHSSSRTPPLQQQYPSLQSSVGRGRGRSNTGSVAQASHTGTASTGIGGEAAGARAVSGAGPAATAVSGGRLKAVLEEPAGSAPHPSAPGAACSTAADAAQAAGPKPADSSSSSSSSPDKQGEGGQSKSAKTAGQPGGATAAAQAGPGSGSGSSSSHGSGVVHQGQSHAPPAAPALSPTQLSSPGSTLSAGSAPSTGAVTSQRQGGSPAGGAAAYQPVLLAAPGRSRASADTERFLTALSGGNHAPSSSTAGGSSSSSVSKPSSVTFGVVPASSAGRQGGHPDDELPVATPTLGPRTQAHTPAAQQRGLPAGASSSSVRASLHSPGASSSQQYGQQSGSEADDVLGPVAGGLSARVLEPSGRVSSGLRQSSSATSEELEQLLQQLSQYEEHLLEEAQTVGGLAAELAGQPGAAAHGRGGEVDASLDSSLSWSQTLAGLTRFSNVMPPPK